MNSSHPAPGIALLLVVALLSLAGCGEKTTKTAPRPTAELAYVDSATCRTCHRAQAKAWTGSHHHLAMQVATDETVLADFDDVTVEHFGVRSTFRHRDGRFFVTTQNASGQEEEFEVTYVFGVDPLQQYLVEFPDGRIQCLLTAWDVAKKEWFFLYDEPIPPGDALHWTGPYQNWNYMCAECHTTDLERNFDLATNTYATTFHEINVGCQACHGPGSRHVAWAEQAKQAPTEYAAHDDKGLAVDLGHEDATVQIEACARCHSRRANVKAEYEYGKPLLDHYDLELLVEPLYFPDGQILDEVYVVGSFLQAKKHARGVRCTDCHDPHSAGLKREGNGLCTHCHQPDPPARLPTLKAAVYDDPSHHHHAPGSAGAACVSCHMPATTYMQVDPRRDHSFRIPRPDLTESLGVPNACTGCHEQEGASWATQQIRTWYPESAARREAVPHFAYAFARARNNDPGSLPLLLAVASDAEQPAIVRATALRELRRFPHPDAVNAAAAAARHEDELLRAVVPDLLEAQVAAGAPPALRETAIRVLVGLLDDPVRLVRTEAARVLVPLAAGRLPPESERKLTAATAEYEERQRDLADRADAHLNLGVLRDAQGRAPEAEASYLQALALDPLFLPARFNLATHYNRLGRNEDAEHMLREILRVTPDSGEAHYSLGLLQAELGEFAPAAASLSRAAALMPGRPRIRYNQALVLQQLQRHDEAEAVLLDAYALDARDTGILEALTLFYAQRRRWAEAETYAAKLAEIVPEAPGPRRLLDQIRQQRRR